MNTLNLLYLDCTNTLIGICTVIIEVYLFEGGNAMHFKIVYYLLYKVDKTSY